MELELDQKLNAMDKLYGQMQQMWESYQAWQQSGFSEPGREQCLQCLVSLNEAAKEADVNIEDVKNSLVLVIKEKNDPNILSSIEQILAQLSESIKKMFLACMHDEGSYQNVLLTNYYQTEFEHSALLLYLVYPFLFPDAPAGHTNQVEVKIIAKLLRDCGYNVDIANTRYAGSIDSKKYRLVLGAGKCFERICRETADTLCICYLTESSPYFANTAELRRLRDFERRNHLWLSFERQSANFLDLAVLSKADAAVCIGNNRTVSTYEGMFKRIFPINATGFCGRFTPESCQKEKESRKNFLWYGGAGPIHKGLDLCLEAFRQLPELKLHIVGEVTTEFYQFYRGDIEKAENILYYGFLAKDSDEFFAVCSQCGYCVSPSCSEGQSTSIITAMYAGMVPVCTPETGLDMDVCGGVWIDDISVDRLAEKIRLLSQVEEEQLLKQQMDVFRYVLENHSTEHYQRQMRSILECLSGEK